MKKLKLLFTSALLLIVSACSTSLEKYSMTATDTGFDTIVSFVAYTKNEAQFEEYSSFLKKEFKRYDALFDKYDTHKGINNIKTINDNAGIKPVKVDKEIIELLEQCQTYNTLSNHQFDITMGSVLELWHETREAANNNPNPTIPSTSSLEEAKKHTGWQHVTINKEDSTVYIDDKAVSLDVGASAKGFAVEKIAQKLEDKGLEHAIINAGGNVRMIGSKPEEETWQVGIQIPNLESFSTDSLLSIKIDDSMSIVTSGDYQRYYMYNDQLMHHIIDPITLMPARYARAVTVITKDSGIADMLSTTLFTMSYQDGITLLNTLKEQGIQADALWVYDKTQPKDENVEAMSIMGYDVVVSDGLKDHIVK